MLISVITCTYNSEKYISECIKSVNKQLFQNYEHIFIDAFSSDNTLDILNKYREQNNDIKIKIFQYPAKGISNAMNLGIKHTKGDIILHLHSDDYLYNEKVFDKVVYNFKNNNFSVLVGNFLSKKKDKLIYNKVSILKNIFKKNYLLKSNTIPHPSTYLKKEIFNKYGGFDENLKLMMDYEYWLRIFRKEKFKFINDYLSVYRIHKNTFSNLNKKYFFAEYKQIINKYKDNYKKIIFFNNVFLLIKRKIYLLKFFLK